MKVNNSQQTASLSLESFSTSTLLYFWMTDGVDEFRVLPENVNYYLELGFKLMKYCKYCGSYYLPKLKNRKRVCCGKKECLNKYNKDLPTYKERIRKKAVKNSLISLYCKYCDSYYQPVKLKKGRITCGKEECKQKHKKAENKKRTKKRFCKSCNKSVGMRTHYCKPCHKKRKKRMQYEYNKEYVKTYTPTENYKMTCHIRWGIGNRLRTKGLKKSAKTEKLLGCTIQQFKDHIAKQFKPGMSWDNWGKNTWHIDHIRPLCTFDLTDPEEQKKAFHYSNCQPLWAKDNMRKSNKLVG